MEEQRNVMSEFAIASLAIGIASFISLAGMEKAILAIVFGALALKRLENNNQLSGQKLAKAGVILGIISIIATTVFIIKFLPKIQQQMMQMQGERGDKDIGGSEQVEEIPGTKLF